MISLKYRYIYVYIEKERDQLGKSKPILHFNDVAKKA